MRRARWTAICVIAAAAASLQVLPASAGEIGPILALDKVVEGTAPAGTQFVVTVECGGAIIREGQTLVASVQRTFDAEGNPVGSDTVEFNSAAVVGPGDEECTVTETGTGDAAEVTYACQDTGASPMCESTGPQAEPMELVILDPNQGATVTVANAFVAVPMPAPTPTPTAEPAPPVVAPPVFTG